VQGGGLVIEKLNRGTAIGGFTRRIGHRVDVIKTERFGDTNLGIGKHAVVSAIIAIADCGEIGGKHHGDRHERESIDRTSFEVGQQTFAAVHGKRGRSGQASQRGRLGRQKSLPTRTSCAW
jgi:hypothetical protein